MDTSAGFRRAQTDSFRQVAELDRLEPRIRKKVLSLTEFWQEFERHRDRASVLDQVAAVTAFIIGEANGKQSEKHPWIKEFLTRAEPYGRYLEEFLESVSLRDQNDKYDSRADRVSLMTLHAAKGLELPVVFMVGCEDGLLPFRPESADRITDLAEERRLFYVGMTRAQEKLILTRSRRRRQYGKSIELPPSPFLADIELALLEVLEAEQRPPRAPKAQDLQMSLF